MTSRTLGRCGVALLLATLVSGCSVIGLGGSDRRSTSASVGDECAGNRSRCIYKGGYEPGEQSYAVDEAARLNQAELSRLRRR